MPVPPALARALAHAALSEEEIERLRQMHFDDAGHGYDPFGLHPAFVGLGLSIAGPIYDRYFRVKSQGHEHIPPLGPAILAGNHSGQIPIDGMMLWVDVLRHTNPPRVIRPVADHFVPSLPFVGTFFARGGVVGGSRGNARALLEAGGLLLVFPEGTRGITKPWKKRYQLQRFTVGHAELAIRHHAPIVPFGVVGAEEQLPQLFASRTLGRPFGIPEVPIPAVPFPLPVRYHIYFGESLPVHEEHEPPEADDPEVVSRVAERVRDAVDALLKRGLAERPGVFQ